MADIVTSAVIELGKLALSGFQDYHGQKDQARTFQRLVTTAKDELLGFEADLQDMRTYNDLRMHGINIDMHELQKIDKFVLDYREFLVVCDASCHPTRLEGLIGAVTKAPSSQIQRHQIGRAHV